MTKIFMIIVISFLEIACMPVTHTPIPRSPKMLSELAQGKRCFREGLYKSAMTLLLPLAIKHQAEAQYAVGYMYYYGYGVAKDKDVGFFWIKEAADRHYEPAVTALMNISH